MLPSNYDEILSPDSLDCSSLKYGRFETTCVIIERNEDKQIETDKKTGKRLEFSVTWPYDSKYVLTSDADRLPKMNVRIISVTPELYECYVLQEKEGINQPIYYKIKRMK